MHMDLQSPNSVVVLDHKSSDPISQITLEVKSVDDCSSESSHTATEAPSISQQILDIIVEYALNKFDDSADRLAAGANKFLADIDYFVQQGVRLEACLPAFPFKSANKVYKVLGSLPDKAEELALHRLHTMCVRIQEVYLPGARVTIISDGITYNGKFATITPIVCIADVNNRPTIYI